MIERQNGNEISDNDRQIKEKEQQILVKVTGLAKIPRKDGEDVRRD